MSEDSDNGAVLHPCETDLNEQAQEKTGIRKPVVVLLFPQKPDCLDCGFAFFYAYPKCNIRLGGSESTTQSSQISDDSTAPIIGSCVFEMNETSE
ncbi:hypothetical protein CRM22_003177 [Opisthorchis felineus]|uniref:Uncharacterized protein n=1 Tax=Opisthorchis felineus TaxID=147828 RepID=A0A4S2M2K9_OPIFE|nr:hypothetical protein CRM22_003177 [Opisthorchis felineus]